MPPQTLAALAHALSAAHDVEQAFVALAEALADSDRDARLSLLRLDGRTAMLVERLWVNDGVVQRATMEVALDRIPTHALRLVASGGAFADVGGPAPEIARLLDLPMDEDGGDLGLRGMRLDGQLVAILALVEPRRVFGTRASERFAPATALFDLAYLRFAERDGRDEASRTLEEVMQRVHAEYLQRLEALEGQLAQARDAARQPAPDAGIALEREREAARVAEEQRRGARRLQALEQQVTAAVGQLESAHVELHRRSEALRQRTRTLHLIDRVLTLAGGAESPKALAEGLLALVGDDMRAQRCSLFLTVPGDAGSLYLATSRGLAPHIIDGSRITVGKGVAGTVAERREPLLVVDASDAQAQPLLGDEYLTTGSFISFPLVLHDELIGVVNLTNRAQRGLFVEEDVERVRLLGLVISLIAREGSLSERLFSEIHVR
jgi:hypothetical protein